MATAASRATGTGNSSEQATTCGPPPAVSDGEPSGLAQEAPPFRGAGLYRVLSNIWTSRKPPSAKNSDSSISTEPMSPQPGRRSGDPTNAAPSTISEGAEGEESLRGEVPGEEEIVPEGGIKPGMEHTIFESNKHGFRLQVQRDSVPADLPDDQNSGPIKVTPLKGSINFEDEKLEGILKVHCLPTGRRFVAPLLFDFLVKGGIEDDPIMDEYGRIRYEVLTRNCDSDTWGRDPESSIPLEIVKDDQGRIYVRAQVRHFSCWGFFFKTDKDRGLQMYKMEPIPWWDRRKHRHQSLIKNSTPEDVTIYAYAMRMSEWTAALESFETAAGADGVEASAKFAGSVKKQVNAASLLPQMVPIPSTYSHWFEIPRVGAGVRSARKAVVAIVTESNDERDGKRLRLEGVVHLRCETKLTVTLRVEGGKVKDSAAASEDGGILSLVMRVIKNQYNATPSNPPPSLVTTELRSRSGVNSAVSSAPTSGAEVSNGRVSGGGANSFSVLMAETEADQDSPCLAATSAAAAKNETDGARSKDEEKSSNTSSIHTALNGAPAAIAC